MPILGPAIIVWVGLAIAAMTYFFFFVARNNAHAGNQPEPEWRSSPSVPVSPLAPAWVVAPAEPSRYEMEEFPAESWRH